MKKVYSFDDVLLVPQRSKVKSRNDVSAKIDFLGYQFSLPIISANMSSVTEYDMCYAMHLAGGLGIIHRMMDIDDQVKIVKELKGNFPSMPVAASIGGFDREIDRAKKLIENGCEIICIDVAHADSAPIISFLLKYFYEMKPRIGQKILRTIIGNYATYEAIQYFYKNLVGTVYGNYGKIAFKMGIGSGSQCTTRIVTGCGLPTLQSLLSCDKGNFDIIADGGIKTSGDIVKSLAAGAKMVMCGSILAGTKETPGSIIKHKGKLYKIYRGSASFGQKIEVNRAGYVEGEETLVPYKGSVVPILQQLDEGIRSACSYLGANSIERLSEPGFMPEFVEISNAGHLESQPHGAL